VSRLPGLTGIIDFAVHNPGGDPTTVLVHSLGTDRNIWDREVEWLTASGSRVVTVDLPGHGASTANHGPYTIDALGTDVAEVAEIVTGSGPYRVMGISIGGLMSIWLALNRPEMVSGLVAANTAARLGSAEGWSDRIAAIEAGGLESVREAVVARFFSAGFPETHPDAWERCNRVFVATDPVGYVGCCAALRDADLRDRVGEITCPTLVVAGEVDVATPPELSSGLHERIAGSTFAVIPGAGHVSNLDRPDEFETVVGGFLSTL
jgi:3-oxoadipate enol-lactonase